MSLPPDAPRRLTGPLLILLSGLAMLGSLATNIVLPAFPDMAQALSVSVKDLSATLASFFIAFAAGQLFVGPLSDRFGRRWLVVGGLAVFVAGSVVCMLAANLSQLIVGRLIQALGACATSVLARAIARDLFEGAELGRALSLIMVAMAAAPGFSPLLGGALSSVSGWRTAFALLIVLAVLLGIRYLGSLGESLSQAHRTELSLPAVFRTYVGLLKDRRFVAPAVSVSLVIGSLFMFFSVAPALLMSGFGFSSLGLSLFFASTVFVVFGAGLMAPRLARRWGPVRAARTGILIALAGSLALLVGPVEVYYFSTALTIFLMGMGLINPLGTALSLQPFAQKAGAASALLGFLQMGCAAVAIFVAASLPFPIHTAFSVVMAVNLGVSLLVFWGVRTQ